MDKEMEVEVFRAGDYGSRGKFSEEDLDRIVEDYDPATHEAPVTVDHQQDGPAFGWVRGLRRVGNKLLARLGGLDAEFRKKLETGAFKKRSIEMYRKLEDTGRPYLKALSFLGAASPVVKGLADPVFSEDYEAPGQCEIPESVGAFCEALRRKGALLPAWEEMGLARFMSRLDGEKPEAFSEKADPQSMRDWFGEFLKSLGAIVPMEEMPDQSAFHENHLQPQNMKGVVADPESMRLHKKVSRYMREHPETAYSEALRSVYTEF
ncbi:MAG: hypothetical protein ACOCVT_02880 [bacterium]